MSHAPTASQTVGPFFSIGLEQHYCAEIAAASESRQRISVRGRVLDGDGEPVPDAVLEVWSAGAGSADRSHERDGAPKYPTGFARVATNEQGEFAFVGAKPVEVRSADGSVHAPHFVVVVFMRGLLRHLVTRLYFPDEPGNDEDVVMRIVPENRRATIVIARDADTAAGFLWDIHLQGERETVFFET